MHVAKIMRSSKMEKYEELKLEVIIFEAEDVITASGVDEDDMGQEMGRI